MDPTTNSHTSVITKGQKCKLKTCDKKKIFENAKDDFICSSTIHGLSYIHNSKSKVRRFGWLMLFLASLVASIYFIGENYKKLKTNLSTVSVSINENDELEFPAVTICSTNYFRKSKVKDNNLIKDYFKILYPEQNENSSNVNMSQSFDLREAILRDGHDIHEMLQECNWKKELKCNHENFTQIFDIDMGKCFTFNGKKETAIKVNTTGIAFSGLELTLNAQPEEYYHSDYSGDRVGFRIEIHNAGEPPLVRKLGFDISPGFYHSLSIERKKDVLRPTISELSCTKDTNYSERKCSEDVIEKKIRKNCNCSVKAHNKTKLCTLQGYRCAYDKAYKIFPGVRECPRPCEMISFNVQHSTSYFPSRSSLPKFIKSMNASTNSTTFMTEFRERYARVAIYYRSLITVEIKEQPAYTMESWFSDLGGLMGLFLGCSLLSLFEIADLLITITMALFWKLLGKSPKVSTKIHP